MPRPSWNNITRVDLGLASGIFTTQYLLMHWSATDAPSYTWVLRDRPLGEIATVCYDLQVSRHQAAQLLLADRLAGDALQRAFPLASGA